MASEYIVSLLLKLNDKLSKPLGKMDDKISKKLSKMGDSWIAAGQKLTKAVTLPILALGGASVFLFGKQEEALAKLENAIRVTGNESTISVEKLKNLSKELQDITLFGDEASLSALALTQQLANLTEDQLTQILPAIQDFSAAMGVDLQTAASLVGKTLGSSTNALTRYGIEFDATLPKGEKFTAMLDAMNSKFGGTAEIIAEKGIGPIKQLQNTLGDAGEMIGASIMPILQSLIDNVLKPLLEAFQSLDKSTIDMIVRFGLLAAAIGPLLIIGGKLMKLFATGISPIHGVMMALAALVTVIIMVNEAMKKALVVNKKRSDAVGKELKETNKLKKEWLDLSKKQKLNREEKQRMIIVETTLRQRIGRTAFEIDEQTGKLRINTEAFEQNTKRKIELQIKLLEAQIDVDRKIFNEANNLRKALNPFSDDPAMAGKFVIDETLDLYDDLIAASKKADEFELKIIETEQQISNLKKILEGETDPKLIPGDTPNVIDETTEKLNEMTYAGRQASVVMEELLSTKGEGEEIPLLTIPTKVKKKLEDLSTSLQINTPDDIITETRNRIEQSNKSTVDVTIKVETDENLTAKVTDYNKTGEANVTIDIDSIMGRTLSEVMS